MSGGSWMAGVPGQMWVNFVCLFSCKYRCVSNVTPWKLHTGSHHKSTESRRILSVASCDSLLCGLDHRNTADACQFRQWSHHVLSFAKANLNSLLSCWFLRKLFRHNNSPDYQSNPATSAAFRELLFAFRDEEGERSASPNTSIKQQKLDRQRKLMEHQAQRKRQQHGDPSSVSVRLHHGQCRDYAAQWGPAAKTWTWRSATSGAWRKRHRKTKSTR